VSGSAGGGSGQEKKICPKLRVRHLLMVGRIEEMVMRGWWLGARSELVEADG
jgi:hypothetical protein